MFQDCRYLTLKSKALFLTNMLNLLPTIHINVKNSPAVFINEMTKIAVQSGEFNVEAT